MDTRPPLRNSYHKSIFCELVEGILAGPLDERTTDACNHRTGCCRARSVPRRRDSVRDMLASTVRARSGWVFSSSPPMVVAPPPRGVQVDPAARQDRPRGHDEQAEQEPEQGPEQIHGGILATRVGGDVPPLALGRSHERHDCIYNVRRQNWPVDQQFSQRRVPAAIVQPTASLLGTSIMRHNGLRSGVRGCDSRRLASGARVVLDRKLSSSAQGDRTKRVGFRRLNPVNSGSLKVLPECRILRLRHLTRFCQGFCQHRYLPESRQAACTAKAKATIG
jgi:hypothetical protein